MSSRYDILTGRQAERPPRQLLFSKEPVVTVELEQGRFKYRFFLKGYSISGPFVQLQLISIKRNMPVYNLLSSDQKISDMPVVVTIQRGYRFCFLPKSHKIVGDEKGIECKFQTNGFDESVSIARFIEGKIPKKK